MLPLESGVQNSVRLLGHAPTGRHGYPSPAFTGSVGLRPCSARGAGRRLLRHAPAFIGAATAGIRAITAMVHRVLCTFIAARLASRRTRCRSPAHARRRAQSTTRPADRCPRTPCRAQCSAPSFARRVLADTPWRSGCTRPHIDCMRRRSFDTADEPSQSLCSKSLPMQHRFATRQVMSLLRLAGSMTQTSLPYPFGVARREEQKRLHRHQQVLRQGVLMHLTLALHSASASDLDHDLACPGRTAWRTRWRISVPPSATVAAPEGSEAA